MAKRPKPLVLTVLDGWGHRAETKGNAIALARKPNYDELLRQFPNTLIQTSGPAVALPEVAKQSKVEKVFVHCFMDGRDTPPNSGRDYVRQLQQKMRELGVGEI